MNHKTKITFNRIEPKWENAIGIGIKNNILCEIGIDTNKTFSIAANNVMFVWLLFYCIELDQYVVLNVVAKLKL